MSALPAATAAASSTGHAQSAPGITRPPLPPGPYVVAGRGRAGRAAAHALTALGGQEVTVWEAPAFRPPPGADPGLPPTVRIAPELTPGAVLERTRARTLVKSPGIPFDDAAVREAQRRGLQVIDELELGWRLLRSPVVAVTGTNGKSTTAALVHAALEAGGTASAITGNTDFGPPLSELASRGAPPDWAVCEVSSYQLEGCTRLLPDAAVLLGVTRDHLHRHGTMARYAAAKSRLLLRAGRAAPITVIDIDGPAGRRIAAACARRGSAVATFGAANGADYRIRSASWTLTAGEVVLETPTGELTLATRLPGAGNARNATAALACAEALGVPSAVARRAIATAAPVPGRFELIDEGHGFDVVVDFAHNPKGIEEVLATARAVAAARSGARVLVVLAACGTHDPGKRPIMGAAAALLADWTVVTTTNSYDDEPTAPVEGLLDGWRARGRREPPVVLDRRDAIAAALGEARDGDIVVVVGRGARTALVGPGGSTVPFDDRAVCRALLGGLGGVAT